MLPGAPLPLQHGPAQVLRQAWLGPLSATSSSAKAKRAPGDARVISSWTVLFCTLSQEGWDRASCWVLFWPRCTEAFLQPLVHQ